MVKLSKQEKELIAQYASDMETGNHLLCPRSPEYRFFCTKMHILLNTAEDKLDEHLKLILEYYKQCSDYDYYQSSKNKLF